MTLLTNFHIGLVVKSDSKLESRRLFYQPHGSRVTSARGKAGTEFSLGWCVGQGDHYVGRKHQGKILRLPPHLR